MRNAILAGALGLALLSSAALAQDTPAQDTLAQDAAPASPAGGVASPLDRQFAGRASASNTFEIRSSQMALRKSRDPAVRDLARWMIDSHTMAERKLQGDASYAEYMGGASPTETPTTSATLGDLSGLDGPAFDKAYVDAQVDSHAMAAQQMQDYAVQGSYAPLLRYEAATLPEVRDHLAHFQALQARRSRGSATM